MVLEWRACFLSRGISRRTLLRLFSFLIPRLWVLIGLLVDDSKIAHHYWKKRA